MYSNWTVKQLKDELKARGGTLKGRKADLVSRLESYDRNFNFGIITQEHETDDIKMVLPKLETYRDINSSTILPPLTRQHIRLYFDEHDKRPDAGLRLYEARFLIVIRASQIGEFTFIKGICKATMRRLQYEVNLKLHKTGTIEESSCECVAGSGVAAHCKHVALTLYGVENMAQHKNIIKYQAPTEKLQKFHAPRSVFTSTPIKTSCLPMKRKKDNIIFSPCSMKVSTNEYNQKFRSLIVNYAHESSMSFKQLYEPANPYAIEVDHSYEKISPVEKLLNSLLLTSVSAETAATIELETRGQSNNMKWEMRRECRLTSLKFHTICHLRETNKGKFAEQLLNRKKFTSKATNHGIINETVALQKYMEETDLQVSQCGLFISTERPFVAASPDGLLGEETTIEIKCPYSSRYRNITHVTVPYLELGENGQLQLKKSSPYYYQVQGQFYCTGRKYCNFIVYTYIDFKVIYVSRNDTFIAEMLAKIDDFYQNHFIKALLNKYLYRNYLDIIKKT